VSGSRPLVVPPRLAYLNWSTDTIATRLVVLDVLVERVKCHLHICEDMKLKYRHVILTANEIGFLQEIAVWEQTPSYSASRKEGQGQLADNCWGGEL
jgi:hypothetical protein